MVILSLKLAEETVLLDPTLTEVIAGILFRKPISKAEGRVARRDHAVSSHLEPQQPVLAQADALGALLVVAVDH